MTPVPVSAALTPAEPLPPDALAEKLNAPTAGLLGRWALTWYADGDAGFCLTRENRVAPPPGTIIWPRRDELAVPAAMLAGLEFRLKTLLGPGSQAGYRLAWPESESSVDYQRVRLEVTDAGLFAERLEQGQHNRFAVKSLRESWRKASWACRRGAGLAQRVCLRSFAAAVDNRWFLIAYGAATALAVPAPDSDAGFAYHSYAYLAIAGGWWACSTMTASIVHDVFKLKTPAFKAIQSLRQQKSRPEASPWHGKHVAYRKPLPAKAARVDTMFRAAAVFAAICSVAPHFDHQVHALFRRFHTPVRHTPSLPLFVPVQPLLQLPGPY